jgi:hypothetical protein
MAQSQRHLRSVSKEHFVERGEEFVNGNYARSGTEAMSSTTSLILAAKSGNVVGLAWTIGWEGGRWVTNRDFYDDWYRNTWHPYRFRHLGY